MLLSGMKKAKSKRGGARPGSGRPATGATKKRILNTIDLEVAEEAKELGVNLSAAAEEGIRRAVKKARAAAEAS